MEKKKLLLICIFTGYVGGHYYAIGKAKKGLLYTFTIGLFYIGWLYDIYRIYTCDDFLALINENDIRSRERAAERKEKRAALVQEIREQQVADAQEQRERLATYRKQGVPYCPKCHSTSLSAGKKGFGYGKGFIGAAVAGPIGAFAGGIGSKKTEIVCMNCGYKFKPKRRMF